LGYLDIYSSIILKNSIDNDSNYNSKFNALDYIFIITFFAIVVFYILYFYYNLLKKERNNKNIKTPSTLISSAPKKRNSLQKNGYHPRVESIRTQTPMDSPRKKSISNHSSLISNNDSIIKSSILPSINNNEIAERQSLKQQLYNLTNNVNQDHGESHDQSNENIYSSYPLSPENCQNLSRLSIESVKGSEVTSLFFDANNEKEDKRRSKAISFSKNKDIDENSFLYKNNDSNSISSISGHFDVNEISVPSPVCNHELRCKSIVKSRNSLLKIQQSMEDEPSNSKDSYLNSDLYIIESKERLISEGNSIFETSSFTEEIINRTDVSPETFKIPEIHNIMPSIGGTSIKNNDDYIIENESYTYEQDKLLESFYRNEDYVSLNSSDIEEEKPINLNSYGSTTVFDNHLKRSKNLKNDINDDDYIKVRVSDEIDNENESISIEDSISSKDENQNKNIPDNTSYLGTGRLNKNKIDVNNDDIHSDSESILKNLKYSDNGDEMPLNSEELELKVSSLNRKRNIINRNKIINTKKFSSLLKKSVQRSESTEDEKENINIENINKIMANKRPPLEISNDIIVSSILTGHDDSEHTYYNKQNLSESTLSKFYNHENNSFNFSSPSTLAIIKRNNSSSVYEYTNNRSPYDSNYRKLRNLRMSSINMKRKPSSRKINKTLIGKNIIIENKSNIDNGNHENYSGDSSAGSSIGIGSVQEENLYQKEDVDLFRSYSNPVPKTKLKNVNETDLRPVKRFYSTMQRSHPSRNYNTNFKYGEVFEIIKYKNNVYNNNYNNSKYRENSQSLSNNDNHMYSPISPEDEDFDRINYNCSNELKNASIRRTLSPTEYSSPKECVINMIKRKSPESSSNNVLFDNNNNNSNSFIPDLEEQEKTRKKCQELYTASLFNKSIYNNYSNNDTLNKNILSSSPAKAYIRDDNNESVNKIAALNDTIHRSLSKLKRKNSNRSNNLNNNNSNNDNNIKI